jgi:gluconokinase
MNVPNLRSPYSKVGRLVYFGRMLDKIRLQAAGRLPADYQGNLGDGKPGMFDTRCCEFLRVSYADIQRRTLEGGDDAAVLAWTEQKGGARTDAECVIWNGFLAKRGWRDDPASTERLRQRIAENGLAGKPVETFFDFIDFDEGRDPVAARSWERI